MKPIQRKLSLNTQTIRNLSADKLGRVVGGISSAKGGMCSTEADTGCLPSGNERCASNQASVCC